MYIELYYNLWERFVTAMTVFLKERNGCAVIIIMILSVRDTRFIM